ncbi:MAG: P-II family nitrogen regulator [Desulfomicrobium sp.]|jgi:nitrogen regulatory protein PII|nr:P-II family nitrogen regulator [Desulfomicrobium sp.]NLV96767.1 P-II family nitrogen regulator [Desulfovibrionales bacterium]
MVEGSWSLIITIVNKDWGNVVIDAAKEAGAKGATVLHGRGCGAENIPHLFGIPIEPEKDIVLNAVPTSISQQVMEAIAKSAALCKPGTGISLCLPLSGAVGLFQGDLQNC